MSARKKKEKKADVHHRVTGNGQQLLMAFHAGEIIQGAASGLIESLSEGFTDFVEGVTRMGDEMMHSYSAGAQMNYSFRCLKDDAWRSLQEMEKVSCFHSLPQLISELFSILDSFVTNQIAAQQFYGRVCEFAIILAHPTKSIYRRTQLQSYTGAQFSISLLESVAQVFSRAVRYCYRFTHARTAVLELLEKSELQTRLIEFEIQLATSIMTLIQIVECESVCELKMEPPSYQVLDDLRELTKLANVHRNEAILLMEKLNITLEEQGGFMFIFVEIVR